MCCKATAALSLVGCEKTVQPEPQEGEFKIERLRDLEKFQSSGVKVLTPED